MARRIVKCKEIRDGDALAVESQMERDEYGRKRLLPAIIGHKLDGSPEYEHRMVADPPKAKIPEQVQPKNEAELLRWQEEHGQAKLL